MKAVVEIEQGNDEECLPNSPWKIECDALNLGVADIVYSSPAAAQDHYIFREAAIAVCSRFFCAKKDARCTGISNLDNDLEKRTLKISTVER